jgi:peptidoglycan/LPS O-acetylase OafA/YrhL
MSHVDRPYRPDIDGLRALAVVVVLFFHAFPARLPGGFVGVDVFFVISGYLISGIILDARAAGRFTFAGFYARRIRRIFPALAVVLAAVLAGGWFLLYADDYARVGYHAAAGAGFVSNIAFWSEASYFDVAAELKPLLHLWSLGVEEQFYLVWPVILVVATRWRRGPLAATLAIGTVSFLPRSGRSGSTAPRPSMRRGIDSGSCWRGQRSPASKPMPISSRCSAG